MKVLTTPRSYGKTDPEVFAMLRAAGLEVVRNETGGILDKEGMKALLADCDGVIVGVDPIDAEVIAAAPKLKAIAKYGVGVDNIDLDAAKARDIKVSRTVGANAEAVADYAMALLLAVARKTVLIDQHCRQGDWKINTARGGLIDENALLDALEAGRLCGAGIDAFSSEPPKDPRWFTLDNVVLGSHCAASTAGASRNMGRMATANLIHDLGL